MGRFVYLCGIPYQNGRDKGQEEARKGCRTPFSEDYGREFLLRKFEGSI